MMQGPGKGKIFHVEHMRRLPYTLTDKARHIIAATTPDGRAFPQALADYFGQLMQVQSIAIDVAKKHEHVPTTEENHDDDLLIIDIIDTQDGHRFLLSVDDMRQYHTSRWHCFNASLTALELVRLYKQVRGI